VDSATQLINRGLRLALLREAARFRRVTRPPTPYSGLVDPDWDCPTTIAKVDGKLLVVCSQIRARHAGTPPRLPFEVAAADLPTWP
jgi:hypothetical protein